MNKLDFLNAVTTFASYFIEETSDLHTLGQKESDVLAKFLNYIGSSQKFDYGIYAEDIKNHKKRVYTPEDSDIIIANAKQLGDYEKVLLNIYINTDQPMVKYYIEALADRYGGSLLYEINILKDD